MLRLFIHTVGCLLLVEYFLLFSFKLFFALDFQDCRLFILFTLFFHTFNFMQIYTLFTLILTLKFMHCYFKTILILKCFPEGLPEFLSRRHCRFCVFTKIDCCILN